MDGIRMEPESPDTIYGSAAASDVDIDESPRSDASGNTNYGSAAASDVDIGESPRSDASGNTIYGSAASSGRESLPSLESYRLRLKQSMMEASSGTRRVEDLEHILRDHPSSEVWKALQDARDDSDCKFNPLHLAVIGGHAQVAEAYLRFIAYHDRGPGRSSNSGSSFNAFDFLHARDAKGHTAVHIAVVSENETILRILISNYDTMNKRPKHEWDFADHIWMTPLHYAVMGNLTAEMNQLLAWSEYDRHVNARDFFQRTPLHIASCHRPVRVEALLQHPAVDINAKDCLSLTPLHWAVYFGRTDVVRCFVKPSPDREAAGKEILRPGERDIENRSVLEIAMEDSLLGLVPEVSNHFSRVPFQNDQFFLMSRTASIHCDVSFKMEKLLLTCPDVSKEAESLEKNLGIYVSAVNAILLVAALTAAASVRMDTENLNESKYESIFFYMAFISKLLSLYMSVATILAGATILRPLGKSVPVARRVKYARIALYRISWLLGISVTFFIVAFYAETAIQVRNDEPSRGTIFPYHIVSGLGGLLCIGVMLWFLRLHRLKMFGGPEKVLVKYVTLIRQYFVSCATGRVFCEGWLRGLWLKILGALLPQLLPQLLPGLSLVVEARAGGGTVMGTLEPLEPLEVFMMAIMVHSIQNFGRVARRVLLKRAKLLYDGYFMCKCVAMEIRDMERTTEEDIEDIGNRGSMKWIKLEKLHTFESTMNNILAEWTEDIQSQSTDSESVLLQIIHRLIFVLGMSRLSQLVRLMQRGLEFRNRYWQLHRDAFEYGVRLLLPIVEKEIVELEKLYVDLSLSQEEEDRSSGRYVFVMDRHYMEFLDRLPRGLFFWLHYWEQRWTEPIAIFGRGYIIERDIRIWSEFSHQIHVCRSTLASR